MTWHSLNDCIPIPSPFQSFMWDGEMLLALLWRRQWKNKCFGQHHTGGQSRKLKPLPECHALILLFFHSSLCLWNMTIIITLFSSLLFSVPAMVGSISLFSTWPSSPGSCAGAQCLSPEGAAEQELSPVISWTTPAAYNSFRINSGFLSNVQLRNSEKDEVSGGGGGKVRHFVINNIASLIAYNWKCR